MLHLEGIEGYRGKSTLTEYGREGLRFILALVCIAAAFAVYVVYGG